MKKRLVVIATLFTILSGIILNYVQPMKYIVENDSEIEWHIYYEDKLI